MLQPNMPMSRQHIYIQWHLAQIYYHFLSDVLFGQDQVSTATVPNQFSGMFQLFPDYLTQSNDHQTLI